MQAPATTSTRPYMVRAMYDWCVDNNCTPFIVVAVDGSVRVPQEFVQNGEIVLNVSLGATSNLTLGNDYIEFKARFGGVARDICVPMGRVSAIYARENGQGMTFPVEAVSTEASSRAKGSAPAASVESPPAPVLGIVSSEDGAKASEAPDPRPPTGPRPSLTRVK
ncbi:MAG: ClpXP protease specificity-enhancing factor [Rhodoferax sp.]|nr:ClpXP protease specificity-enhancing factor [Rhodoferax sp.]